MPMAKRTHTTAMGEISETAILVAMNDAPQTITANRASRYGRVLGLDMVVPVQEDGEL